jgi:hypothetical protein
MKYGDKQPVRAKIFFVLLVLVLGAMTQAQAPRAPEINLNKTELVFAGVVNKTTLPNQFVDIINSGSTDLTISSIVKSGSGAFALINPPTTPYVLPANGKLTLEVRFKPTSTVDHGQQLSASVTINSNDSDEPSRTISLYGLSAEDIEGAGEPGLKNVVEVLGYKINVGWSGLVCGSKADNCDPKEGEEVLVPLFRKAPGATNITIKAVGRYSPNRDILYGWYTPNGTNNPSLNQVAVITEAVSQTIQYPPNYQTLNPTISGSTSFNPGNATFGIYVLGLEDRLTFTEDHLNEATNGPTIHAVRVYPLRDRAGNLVPNSFLLGFEDATNGDYQDYMFVIGNVVDANTPQQTPTSTNTPITPTVAGVTPSPQPTNTPVPPTDEPTLQVTATSTTLTETPGDPTETSSAPTSTSDPNATSTDEPGSTSTPDATANGTSTPEGTATTEATETPQGPTATPTNTPDISTGVEVLMNGGFEMLIDGWKGKNLSRDRVKCNKDTTGDGNADKVVARTGVCAFMFKGDVGEFSQITQILDPAAQPYAAGDSFAFNGYFKAKPNVAARVRMTVKYTDITLPKSKIKADILPSDDYAPILEFTTINGAMSVIKVRVQHFSTSGKLWVDDLSVLWIEGGSNGLISLPQ